VIRGIPLVVVTAKDLNQDDIERLNGDVSALLQKTALPIKDLLHEIQAAVPTPAPRSAASS